VSYPASGASMLHTQVCALERLHTLTLLARPKTAPRRQGLPLRAYVPRSCVCTSVPTHLESRSISEDSATTAGFGPAEIPGAGSLRVYVPRSCVCTSAPTHLEFRSASENLTTTVAVPAGSPCCQQAKDLGFGDMSLDGTLPRPGLPWSRGLRNSRPFPPAAHAASRPWTWVSET